MYILNSIYIFDCQYCKIVEDNIHGHVKSQLFRFPTVLELVLMSFSYFLQEHVLQVKFDDDLRKVQREAEQKLESILEETKNQVELLKLENDSWKEKLIKESWRKLQDVEKRFKIKMDNVEAGYRNQLDEAEKEAQKREELFLTSMKRKSAATRDNSVHESNSEIGKLSLEVRSPHLFLNPFAKNKKNGDEDGRIAFGLISGDFGMANFFFVGC